MKPHLYKRNLTRSLWDCASTSYRSVDQLPLLVNSKQPHWWQFRAAWLKMSSRFAKTHLSTQWAGQRELGGSVLAGPGPGVGWLCQEPGTVRSWHSQGFRRALVFLCATALLRDVLAQSEVAFVFISARCPALVCANPLFSQVCEL